MEVMCYAPHIANDEIRRILETINYIYTFGHNYALNNMKLVIVDMLHIHADFMDISAAARLEKKKKPLPNMTKNSPQDF